MTFQSGTGPSNDNTPSSAMPLDLGLMLTIFGLVAVIFGLMSYGIATGSDNILSALRR
jgi:hypothetical protein